MAAPTRPLAHDGSELLGPSSSQFLIVLGPGGLQRAYPLPDAGELQLGRAEDAQVRITDPGVSRYHARLHVGAGIEIEDLGSANGTFVRDQRIAPGVRCAVAPGEVIGMGATIASIQSRVPALDAARVCTHVQFEARLIEGCARAESIGRSFALVRLDVRGDAGANVVEPALLSALGPGDLAGLYSPGRYEVLLDDTDLSSAQAQSAKLRDALDGQGLRVDIGLAFCPTDGLSPGEVFAKACARVREGSGSETGRQNLIVVNAAVRKVYDMAERAARGTISVLVRGETGVGKELLAETIHRCSPRADKPFVSLNCAALSHTLLESELFGYERGAFTGAITAKQGLLEAASGGTLFLDEVGEMAASMQAKLLRALESREILRVGATKARPVDVRVVAATNRDLEEEVAAGRFRRDLYFRLNGMTLELPPLRERVDEIEPLARLVLETIAPQLDRPAPDIAPDALALLLEYPWPGNVRELRNVMERALLLCGGSTVRPEHLPEEKMRQSIDRERATAAPEPQDDSSARAEAGTAWRRRRAETEKQAMEEALARCNGNRSRSAELLGMPRSTFMRKLVEYGLSGPRADP